MAENGSDREDGVVGRVEEAEGGVSAAVAVSLAATLGEGPAPVAPGPGDPLPPLWHWCAFWPTTPMAGLGPDGHARLGPFLPDLGLPRRMWAGGRVLWEGTLTVGETLTRRSEITALEMKETRAGPMGLVTVVHDIAGAAGRVREEHDIVYLRIPDRYTPPKPIPAPADPVAEETVETGPVRLFRYSALTFNGHRIHYDRTYATEVEHYPALVVHGPLQATLLAGLATRHRGAPPVRFRYRGVHPMFDTDPLRLIAAPGEGGSLSLCTAAPAGHQGMQATADWA